MSDHKLFRAIVVLGASLTAGTACNDSKCHHCSPPAPDASAPRDAPTDVAVTDGPTGDAVDAILIL